MICSVKMNAEAGLPVNIRLALSKIVHVKQ